MAKKVSTNNKVLTSEEIANNTWQYIMNKVKSFFPYYLMAFLLLIPFVLILRKWTLVKFIKELLQSIPLLSLTFLGWGVRGKLCLLGSWFLSAMIIACFVLYPMLLKNYHISTKLIFPLLGMVLVSYNYKCYSSITALTENVTFLAGGIIRAISEIAIGASIYELSLKIKSLGQEKSFFCSVILTSIKYFSYLVAILYATRFYNSITDIDYLLWLVVAVTLSFSGVGFAIKESSFTRYLGKISLPVYIFHMLVVSSAYQVLGKNISMAILILIIVTSILFSVAFMYITDFFVKKIKVLAKVC